MMNLCILYRIVYRKHHPHRITTLNISRLAPHYSVFKICTSPCSGGRFILGLLAELN